jgi:hypothetical protein
MHYDIWTRYDPWPQETPEERERRIQRIERNRRIIRNMLPHLRQLIEDPKRDPVNVSECLRPYHAETDNVPMEIADLPEIEALCRLVLEKGGLEQNLIQRVLLSLVASTAAQESVPFLLEMLHYSRRGDHFGPERRQLALWGLARIALAHNVPEAYAALQEGLKDHHADVRLTATDLNLDAYLGARRQVPPDIVATMRVLATSDPDEYVRRAAQKYLREPWAEDIDVPDKG